MDSARLDWRRFREQMPITGRWAYFDHAAVAPLTRKARDAISSWLNQAVEEGNPCWPAWNREVERTRQLAARLVGADPEEIALVGNTTDGITLVAECFPWRDGDNVVIPANEFPTNQYPWLNLARIGVETRRVPVDNGRLDLNRLAEACDGRTQIIAASWVGYLSGWRSDPAELAELAHSKGALLLLDAIQGLGAFPLDVRSSRVDFLAADGHKWMLGPEGAGILFIRREHLDRLRPLRLGWNSVKHHRDYQHIAIDLKESAARYEGGSANMAGFLGLGGSLETLLDCGIEAIGKRIVDATSALCDDLRNAGATIVSPRETGHESGIVSFHFPDRDSRAIKRKCLDLGVVLAARGAYLRASPHGYVDESDSQRLLAALREP